MIASNLKNNNIHLKGTNKFENNIIYYSGNDFNNLKPDIRYTKGVLKNFLPQIILPFSMLIWGLQGQGKSSFSLLLADELTQHGKVLYFCTEEKMIFGRITNRLNNLHISNDNIKFVDTGKLSDLLKILKKNEFQTVIIDSISMLEDKDYLLQLKKDYVNINFIFIAHSEKLGRHYVGNREFAYAPDYEITVDKLIATVLKNRDGAAGKTFNILDVINKKSEKVKYKYRIIL